MRSDRAQVTNKEYMHECFRYQQGELIWRARPAHHFKKEWHQQVFNSRQQGTLAGTDVSGYRMVRFHWGKIGVHRIVFLMHHGYLPEEVDHINGNPMDNRIENLREASHTENLRNMRTPSHNTSGRKGVSWHKASNKWAVGIRQGGKWSHLGLFKEMADAIKCRADAELEVYGEFSNGR